jgi:hypothetical protein
MIKPNHVIAIGCGVLLAFLPACSGDSDHADVQFAKTTFFSMVNGTAAETAIDWETFLAVNKDIGAQYRALPGDTEKADFRKTFLVGFSATTPNLKAKPDLVTHWRVKNENPSETTVAADMTHQDATLLITVSKRSGSQKISSLQVKQ